MLTLRWSIKALIDFDEAQSYIDHENPAVAQLVAGRIHHAARLLQSNPGIGRPAHVPDARIWIVQRTPYVIIYRVHDDALEVVRLWHGRRDCQRVDD